MKFKCSLCSGSADLFYQSVKQVFYKCRTCEGVFAPPSSLPDRHTERERYLSHNNDVNDLRYQQFVSPIVKKVTSNFAPGTHCGLDFGAGTGPVITKLLSHLKYQVSAYDPIFINKQDLLTRTYDFIACCEVMEHFHNPRKEFRILRKLLSPAGKLYCMTHLYSEDIDFAAWYYKNDPTHVFLYQKQTIEFITRQFGFSKAEIEGRLISFAA